MTMSPVLACGLQDDDPSAPGPAPNAVTARYASLDGADAAIEVELRAGAVIVDGEPIAAPRFSGAGVTWSYEAAGRHYAGSLHMAARGALLSGFIAQGPTGQAQPRSVLLAAEALAFTTQLRATSAGQPPQPWTAGPALTLAIDFEGGLPTAKGQIGSAPANITVLGSEGGAVRVAVTVDEWVHDTVPFPCPQSSEILIAFDGTSFTGTMTPFADGAAPAAACEWSGALAAPAPAPLRLEAALQVGDPGMSLADLVSIDTSGSGAIAKQKFQDFIVYMMNDDWREQLTSAVKPVLTPGELAAVNQSPDFYTDRTCDAFLLQLMSTTRSDAGGPSTPLSDDDKLKLRFYWQQKVAMRDGYADQSSRLTQLSYEAAAPRTSLYINDKTTDWAQQLYAALTTDAAMTQVVLAFIGDGWRTTVLDRQTELLLALSPDRNQTIGGAGNAQPCTYATLYHAKAMAVLAQKVMLQGTFANEASVDDFTAWVPAWIDAMAAALATGIADPSLAPGQKALYEELQQDLDTAVKAAGSRAALANEISTGIVAADGKTTLGKLSNWLKTSKLALGASKLFSACAYGFALFQVINAFKGWSQLTDAQRAQTVTSAVELGVNLMADMGELAIEQIIPRLATAQIADLVTENLFEGLELGHDFFSDTTARMAEELAAPVIGDTESAFSKVIATGQVFMKGFAVLGAAAAVAFSCYKLFEDSKDGASRTIWALDICQLAANVLVLASAVAAAAIGECALAAAGPFGVVAGVVLAVVEAFLPHPPPPKPADTYMDQTGTAVLSRLDSPPDDWVRKHPTPAASRAAFASPVPA